MVDGDKYKFKPVLSVHDRKGLLKLLTSNDAQGLGGVLVEEVEESVPNAAKALKVNIPTSVALSRDINFYPALPTLQEVQDAVCYYTLLVWNNLQKTKILEYKSAQESILYAYNLLSLQFWLMKNPSHK